MCVSRQVDTDFCFLFSPFLISVKSIVSNILGLMYVCTYVCMYAGICLLLTWELHKYLCGFFFLLFLNQTFILSIDLHTIVRNYKERACIPLPSFPQRQLYLAKLQYSMSQPGYLHCQSQDTEQFHHKDSFYYNPHPFSLFLPISSISSLISGNH